VTPVVHAAITPVTLVGTTNAGPLAGIDERGGLHGVDGAWSLDWWVGADDRWHFPQDEAAVRQRLLDATPVVETAMRVPTGDAIATVFGARVGGLAEDLVALDLTNDSTLPFALALVLTGRSTVVVDGTRALIDEATEVRFGRAPSRWAVGAEIDDVRAAVLSGAAGDDGSGRGRVAAVLFPLAHTARLRTTLTVPAGGPVHQDAPAHGTTPAVAAAPEADQVARGWRSQLDRGMVVRLPDDRLGDAVASARAQILLAAAGPADDASTADLAALIGALVHEGFGDEAGPLVALLATRQRLTGRFGRGARSDRDTALALIAFGDHWRLTRDRSLGDALVGPVAKAAHRIGKRTGDAVIATGLSAAVDLLAGAAQQETAALVAALPAAGDLGDVGAAARISLDRLLDETATDEVVVLGDRARFAPDAVRLLRRMGIGLVDDETPTGAPPGVEVFSGFPLAWMGQGVEVHDAPTRHGLLSCAVRWHGERPALLWDRRPWPDAPPDEVVRLSAPALDPGWSTTDRQGEALLAAPSPPDLEASFS
jgi:hypothetical protein